MSSDKGKPKKKNDHWPLRVFFLAVVLSALLSFLSSTALGGAGYVVATLVLLAFIALGIVFDMIGVAATSATEKEFHSMAAHRVRGAREAVWMTRNAEKVSSICNDVVGDICGVVSGSASATIAALILTQVEVGWPRGVSLVMSALVAGLTVGGKAIGKTFAVNSCTQIVHMVGRVLHALNGLHGKKKK